MNRVIKFRAWDKKDNKWLLGYEFRNLGGFSMFGEVMMMGEYAQLLSDYFPEYLDNIELMQFTGLHDKNGKEIYEGDILDVAIYKPMVVGWSVKFSSFALNREGWPFSHWFGESCNPEDCEVIGNVHENPELII